MVQLFSFRHHVNHSGVGGKFPHHWSDDVANFSTNLAKGLDNLERAAATEFMSCAFVASAIDLLRTTHAGVLVLVEKLRLPLSASGEEWLNEYMDETVKLLEVCNVLKVGVSGFEQYQMLVDLVVRSLDVAGNIRHQVHRGVHTLNACKQEMVRIENEHRILIENKIEAEGKLSVNLADKHVENKFVKWNGFWGVLFALKNTSSYICRLILSGIVYVGPIPALNAELVSVKSVWALSLVRLHQRVSEEIAKTKSARKCTVMLSHEVEVLECYLADLRALLQPISRGAAFRNDDGEKFKQTVQFLKINSQKLSTSVETLDWHVNDLFDDVVDGRNKLLDMCRRCV